MSLGILFLMAALSVSPMAGQAPSDTGVAEGRAQAARGDFYRALLTLKDATRQLEARPEARPELARAYASLAWACLGMNQPEEAQAAVERALKIDPGIVVASPDFPATVVSLFDRARRPAEGDPEEAGRRALKSGRPQEALLEFLRALETLPAPAAAEETERIRREVIETVMGMDPKPQVTADARKHLEKANDLEEAQSLFGAGTRASAGAILEEFEAAVRLAPWWPEALFGLAQTQHSLGRLEESLSTLRLYKLADPAGRVSAGRNPAAAPESAAATPPAVGRGTLALYCHKFRGPGRPKVKCDDARFADLGKERMIEIAAEPGLHMLRVHNKNLSVRILPGSTHYVRAKVVGFPAHFEIEEVTAEVAEAEIKALKILPNEARYTFSNTCGVGKK